MHNWVWLNLTNSYTKNNWGTFLQMGQHCWWCSCCIFATYFSFALSFAFQSNLICLQLLQHTKSKFGVCVCKREKDGESDQAGGQPRLSYWVEWEFVMSLLKMKCHWKCPVQCSTFFGYPIFYMKLFAKQAFFRRWFLFHYGVQCVGAIINS